VRALLVMMRRRDIMPLGNEPSNVINKVGRHFQEPIRFSPSARYPDIAFVNQFLRVNELNL
jgi:hypothetical protein